MVIEFGVILWRDIFNKGLQAESKSQIMCLFQFKTVELLAM